MWYNPRMLDVSTAFATFPVLHTPRFVLRAPVLSDAPAVFAVRRDPEVLRYFGKLPMTEESAAVDWVRALHDYFAAHSSIRWIITVPGEDEYIGSCGFWRILEEHDRAEVGYELAPAWWGRGVMTEVLAAVLAWGFATLHLHSVEAHIHPANTGSRRVLEKVGFVQEGYFRQNYYDVVEQGFTDTAVFSLLAPA